MPTDELLPEEMQKPSLERVEPDGHGDVLPLPYRVLIELLAEWLECEPELCIPEA